MASRIAGWWAAVIPIVLSCLGGLLALTWTSLAATYSCGDPHSKHCYGTASWQEQTEYFGAYSDIIQAAISCPRGCGGFIDDEIWLVDNKSSACTGNEFEMCWVEAGYTIDEGQSPVFFWADGRPLKQSTYNLHLLGKTDPVGATNHFMIIKDGRVTPNTFLVLFITTL